jgi:DNA mismatch endonuclease, patch repair protein
MGRRRSADLPARSVRAGDANYAEAKHTPRDPAVVSRNMRAIRSRDNKAERLLRGELWRRGHRYRRYCRLPGTPDLVFPRANVAVFVDGDFWHGRLLVEAGYEALLNSLHTERRGWWMTKVGANEARDRRVDDELSSLGWVVLRLWERDILADPVAAANRVCVALHALPHGPLAPAEVHGGGVWEGSGSSGPSRLRPGVRQ